MINVFKKISNNRKILLLVFFSFIALFTLSFSNKASAVKFSDKECKSEHTITVKVTIIDEKNQGVAGANPALKSFPGSQCNYGNGDDTNSRGIANLYANCMGNAPYISDLGLPSGYEFTSATANWVGVKDNRNPKTVTKFNDFRDVFGGADSDNNWFLNFVWQKKFLSYGKWEPMINANPTIELKIKVNNIIRWDLQGITWPDGSGKPALDNKNRIYKEIDMIGASSDKKVNFNHQITNQSGNTAKFTFFTQKCYADADDISKCAFTGSGRKYDPFADKDTVGLATGVQAKWSIGPFVDSETIISKSAPNGSIYCERVVYRDQDGPGGPSDPDTLVAGLSACYKVKNLDPPILSPVSTVTGPNRVSNPLNNDVTFKHVITNNSKYSVDYRYRWHRFKVPAGSSQDTIIKNINNDAGILKPTGVTYEGGQLRCIDKVSVNGTGPPDGSSRADCGSTKTSYNGVNAYSSPATDANGMKVCEYISYGTIDPSDVNTDIFENISGHSNLACFTVVQPVYTTVSKYPYFRLINGGVLAGCRPGLLAGFFNNAGPKRLGAGTTLSAISYSQITGFSSGFGSLLTDIAQKPAQRTTAIPAIPAVPAPGPTNSAFTFANSGTGNDLTSVADNPDNPKLGGYFGGLSGSGSCYSSVAFSDPTDIYNDSTAFTGGDPSTPKSFNGPATIAGRNISNGTNVSLNIKGDVYIGGDIKYANTNWTTTADMPSFVIKATGNIFIDKNVTQLDGTYISNGAIYTCSSGINQLPSASNIHSDCNKQLLVYGSFMAKKVNLLRSIGDINDTDTKATCTNQGSRIYSQSCAGEVFIFSPEMNLNKTDIRSSTTNTTLSPWEYIKSLPPVL